MEEAQLNIVGQFVLDEVKKTFSELVQSRAFNGLGKPVGGQFPPIFASKNASSRFVDSLTYKINPDVESGLPYITIESSLPENENYGKYIDSGRQIGTFPNIAAIEQWIGQKGITPKLLPQRTKYQGVQYKMPTMKQLVFLLSRSIYREGIFPYQFSEITLDRIQNTLAKKLEGALAEHVNRLIRERIVFIINPNRQTR